MSDTSQMIIEMKTSALRGQYNKGVELYFDCVERIDQIKNFSPITVDKVDLSSAKSRKNYYAKQNRALDEFITNNIKLSEKIK